jgi:TonB family protein
MTLRSPVWGLGLAIGLSLSHAPPVGAGQSQPLQTTGAPPPASASPRPDNGPWPPVGVNLPGEPGVTPPRAIRQVQPQYTQPAMSQKLQGVVGLSCVIEADGSVGPIRVIQSLDRESGLDDAAVAAARQWLFTPGTKDGQPVRVLVRLNLGFALRGVAPPESWPTEFTAAAFSGGAQWIETSAEAANLRLNVAIPEGWTVSPGGLAGHWLILKRATADALWILDVREPVALQAPIAQPLPLLELQVFADRMRPLLGFHAQEAGSFGQFRTPGLWWIWFETKVPTLEPTGVPEELRQMAQEMVAGARVWGLVTMPGPQEVTVMAAVFHRGGLSDDEIEAQTREAGAAMAAILRRISIEPR